MIEEIQEKVEAFKKKYQASPDIICADPETLRRIVKEIPQIKSDPNEVYPSVFGMTLITNHADGYGYQLFEKFVLDRAVKDYDKNLYPSSVIKVHKTIALPSEGKSEESSAVMLSRNRIETISVPQGVIGAYKRYLQG